MTSGDKVVVARTFGAPEKRGVLLSFRKLDVHDPVRLSHVSSLLDGLPRGTKIASAFLFGRFSRLTISALLLSKSCTPDEKWKLGFKQRIGAPNSANRDR